MLYKLINQINFNTHRKLEWVLTKAKMKKNRFWTKRIKKKIYLLFIKNIPIRTVQHTV